MKSLHDSLHTIDNLRKIIDNYMTWDVNGKEFKTENADGHKLEFAFEDALREMLDNKGFKVFGKHNVRNINKLITEKYFSGDVDDKVPDIAVECINGLVLLEIKYCNKPEMYKRDDEKIAEYLRRDKCVAAGVLFLDEKQYPEWKKCYKNTDYYYRWKLEK